MVALTVLVHFPLIALSFITLSRAAPFRFLSGRHTTCSNHPSLANALASNSSAQSSMTPVSSFSAQSSIAPISSSSATKTTTAQMPTGTSSPPATSKYVIAHFMVGNVYSFTVDNWLADIALAHSSGIDGFALNVGVDDWQPQQVANAYVPNYTEQLTYDSTNW